MSNAWALALVLLSIPAGGVFAQPSADQASETESTSDSEDDAWEAVPRELTPQRSDMIMLDPVTRADAWWLQAHVGGSIYDARRNLFLGRWSPGLQAGRRFSRFGAFAMLELDQTFEFTLQTERLDVLNAGVGFEVLTFLGHVRSSIAVGASVLLSSTAIEGPGKVGWFVDLRPAALRWALSPQLALELTPISLDVIVPVVEGIPLVVFSNMTLVAVEWSLP